MISAPRLPGEIGGWITDPASQDAAPVPEADAIRKTGRRLGEIFGCACRMGAPELPGSGRQEYPESVVNNVLFRG